MSRKGGGSDTGKLTVYVAFEVELWRGGRHWQGVVAVEQIARAGHRVVVFCRPVHQKNSAFDFLRSLGVQIIQPGVLVREAGLAIRYLVKALLFPAFTILYRQSPSETRRQLSKFDGRILEYLWLKHTLSRCAERDRPDLLHAFGPTQWTATAITWASDRRIPPIYTETGEMRRNLPAYHATVDAVLDKCVAITVHGHRLANEFRQRDYRGLVKVVPFGVPAPGAAALGLNRRESGAITIGCAARFDRLKGIHFLIDALAHLKPCFPEVRLRLAGEGSEYRNLVNHAQRLGLSDAVEFAEPYRAEDGLGRFMDEIDIYCLPSLSEGQPVSVIEAMAYGKPIVATDVGTVSELLEDGAGLVIPAGDVTLLTDALLKLIGDEQLRVGLARKAREKFLAVHQANATGRGYLELYCAVLAEHAGDQPIPC